MIELTIPAEVVTRFTVPGEPSSKARARFTKYGSTIRAWTPEETQRAERETAAAYLRSLAGSHRKPTDTEAAFGVMARFYCGTGQRRDVDNMIKLICDSLNGIAWVDDNQVALAVGQKTRVPKAEARTEVEIYALGQIERPKAICENCGQSYNTYASWGKKRFCTQECHLDFRRRARTRECANCGKSFESNPGNGHGRFCSRPCANAARTVALTCVECGTDFRKPRSLNRAGVAACSEECRTSYWRKWRGARAVGVCSECGGPTSKKTYKRCRACHIANPKGAA